MTSTSSALLFGLSLFCSLGCLNAAVRGGPDRFSLAFAAFAFACLTTGLLTA